MEWKYQSQHLLEAKLLGNMTFALVGHAVSEAEASVACAPGAGAVILESRNLFLADQRGFDSAALALFLQGASIVEEARASRSFIGPTVDVIAGPSHSISGGTATGRLNIDGPVSTAWNLTSPPVFFQRGPAGDYGLTLDRSYVQPEMACPHCADVFFAAMVAWELADA